MAQFLGMSLIGAILIALGVVNIRGNISTIHWYNRSRVRSADVPKYGRCVGSGTVLIGASVILSALLMLLTGSEDFAWVTLAGCALGLGMILYGQFKYNGGLF